MKNNLKLRLGIVMVTALFLLAGCQQPKKEEVKSNDSVTKKEERLVKDVKEEDFFVDAKWVNDAKESENTIILEASYGDGKAYKKGHLPKALHMDTMEIETEESHWNILPAKESEKAFLDKGITKDTELVVYSEDINAASRIAFVAYWLGVENVKILDGGLKAWEKAGFDLEKGVVKSEKASEFGVKVPARPESLLSTPDDVLAAKEKNAELVLASIRSWDEFVGKVSGYDYIENAGEPYGAVFAKSSKSSADVAYLLNEDGTIMDPTEIFKEWKEWGITPDKEVAFYCGTGWRAATAFFICQQLGWDNVKLYDGGWYEWDMSHQKDPSKYPVQIGDPRDPDKLKILK